MAKGIFVEDVFKSFQYAILKPPPMRTIIKITKKNSPRRCLGLCSFYPTGALILTFYFPHSSGAWRHFFSASSWSSAM